MGVSVRKVPVCSNFLLCDTCLREVYEGLGLPDSSVHPELSQHQHQLHRPSPFVCNLNFSLLGLHRACFDKTQPVTHRPSALFLHCIQVPNQTFLVRHIILRTAHPSFQKDARRSQKEKSSVGPDTHKRTHPTSRQGGPPTAVRYILSLVLFIRPAPRTPRVFTFTDTSDTLHCRSSLPACLNSAFSLLLLLLYSKCLEEHTTCLPPTTPGPSPTPNKPAVPSFPASDHGPLRITTWGRASGGACPTSTLGFLHHSRPLLFLSERGHYIFGGHII